MKHSGTYLAITAGVAMLCGCGDKEHLSEGEMADVLADMAIANGYSQVNGALSSDSAKNVMRLAILRKHGITQEELDRSLEWYGHNLDKFPDLNERIEKELAKRESRYLASSERTVDVKEASIWPYSPMAMLSGYSNSDAVTFSIPASDFEKGERFSWSMKLSANTAAQMVLGVDYKEGGTSYTSRRFTMNPRLEVELLTDSSKNISRVYGVMSIDNPSVFPIWTDSIMLRHLPFSADAYMSYGRQQMYDGPHKRKATATDGTAAGGASTPRTIPADGPIRQADMPVPSPSDRPALPKMAPRPVRMTGPVNNRNR